MQVVRDRRFEVRSSQSSLASSSSASGLRIGGSDEAIRLSLRSSGDGSVATAVIPSFAQYDHPAGDPTKLGKVNFPISCDPALQAQFNSAVAMLHSFWYEKTADAFASVADG
jgi:hypothetical protein